MTLLIGQDTELFLKDGNTFISAYGVIPGSKHRPYPVKKGAVQVDGMALEFNTLPAKTFSQFKTNINTVLSRLQDMIPDEYDMVVNSTADFNEEYLNNQPEEARMLGCDPDFDAYTGDENMPPDLHPTMRTAAGHVHLGWTKDKDVDDPDHMLYCQRLVRQLDYFLGVPSILFDKDQKRREMYGKAGAFRPKSYGLEYRVLSNYWITQERFMKQVFINSHAAFRDFKNGKIWEDIFRKHTHGKELSAQRIINEADEHWAKAAISSIDSFY